MADKVKPDYKRLVSFSLMGPESGALCEVDCNDGKITRINPYEFDTDETITADELKKVLQDREIYLASEKKRTEEWRASQGNGGGNGASPAAQAANTVSKGSFNW